MRTCERTDTGASRSRNRSAGFTLIELTVVLAVITTLALILTPAFANFISDSRVARARTDAQTLAAAIASFYKDTGFYPQWSMAQNGGPGTAQNKVDLLVSGGNVPSAIAQTTWTSGTTDVLTDQLIHNVPGYALKTANAQFGWNGPYLSSEIGTDPWNNRYMVNIGLLDPTAGAQGQGGATKKAVWILTAGPNGIVETTYSQSLTSATVAGDDIGTRVQ